MTSFAFCLPLPLAAPLCFEPSAPAASCERWARGPSPSEKPLARPRPASWSACSCVSSPAEPTVSTNAVRWDWTALASFLGGIAKDREAGGLGASRAWAGWW